MPRKSRDLQTALEEQVARLTRPRRRLLPLTQRPGSVQDFMQRAKPGAVLWTESSPVAVHCAARRRGVRVRTLGYLAASLMDLQPDRGGKVRTHKLTRVELVERTRK